MSKRLGGIIIAGSGSDDSKLDADLGNVSDASTDYATLSAAQQAAFRNAVGAANAAVSGFTQAQGDARWIQQTSTTDSVFGGDTTFNGDITVSGTVILADAMMKVALFLGTVGVTGTYDFGGSIGNITYTIYTTGTTDWAWFPDVQVASGGLTFEAGSGMWSTHIDPTDVDANLINLIG